MTKLAEQIRQGADQAWVSLSEGWRELSTRASGALTLLAGAADHHNPCCRDAERRACVDAMGISGSRRVRES